MNLNFLLLLNTVVFLQVAGTPLQLESKKNVLMISLLHITGMPEQGVQGMQLAPPFFGSSVNPIPNGGGQIMPANYYWHPQLFSPSCYLIYHILISLDQACSLTGSFAPNPADCGSYLICNHKKYFAQRCSPGLHWDNKIKACNFIQVAGCEPGEIHR